MDNATDYSNNTMTTVAMSTTYYDVINETTEYVPVYDYFDRSDRINYVLKTPHKIGPLILETVAISANLLCIAAIFQVGMFC